MSVNKMTSEFTYDLKVTSEKEITPRITGAIIERILKKYFKDGECEVELTGYSGSNKKEENNNEA